MLIFKNISSFKKWIILGLSFSIAIFCGLRELCKPGRWLDDSEIAHAISYFSNLNHVDMDVDQELNLSDLRIVWELDGPPGEHPIAQKVLFDGEQLLLPDYVYGWNYFSVWYRETMTKRFSHFKTNNWHSNSYTFIIKQNNGVPIVKLKIAGPDAPLGVIE